VPRQNRVTPGGDIVSVPQRGTLTGNRGVLHDAHQRIVRPWQLRRWIACATEFRGRHREIMTPGRWTELFFLDEATALAAGHRPCGECRNADHRRFRAAFGAAHGGEVRAEAMDVMLHRDRLEGRRCKRTYEVRLGDLPDGTMVELEGGFYLVSAGELVCWSFGGYLDDRLSLPAGTRIEVLTPRAIVDTIAAGYAPSIHGSAHTSGGRGMPAAPECPPHV
jgi:hypothetical protein